MKHSIDWTVIARTAIIAAAIVIVQVTLATKVDADELQRSLLTIAGLLGAQGLLGGYRK